MKILLAGNMARDAAVAERLAQEGCELHVAAEIQNPNLVSAANLSEGRFYSVNSVSDPREIARVALEAQADLFLTNSDEALANGVVDEVVRQMPGMLVASPDRESSRIEWDKFDTRRIIAELDEDQDTSYNPFFAQVSEFREILPAIRHFQDRDKEIVVKPRGLTGGKGVKVMGPHLEDYTAVSQYASEVLSDFTQQGLLLEEKLEGHEFTVQGFTDGNMLIAPPVTYDYPYREDGDKGPGTGGMGSFTMPPGEQLPFLTDEDNREAFVLMCDVLRKQHERGRDFKGLLYGSFFKTSDGLKVVEFNARMGDPEGLNVVELLAGDTPLHIVLRDIATGELSDQSMRFKRLASTALYLVSPDYAYRSGNAQEFELDLDKVAAAGCRTYFGAAERVGLNHYQTTGSSRTVALTSRALTPWGARKNIHEAIRTGVRGPLQYRHDIGDHDYVRIELNR